MTPFVRTTKNLSRLDSPVERRGAPSTRLVYPIGMAVPRQIALLQGAKFTSARVREGWTHYHVVGVARTADGWAVELAASCDVARRLVVPARELKDRVEWAPGWTPLSKRP